ncbi:S8 family serine peptidase [Saliphagus sp. LR7]|uniref:S8 family peptidase n=1 Tax=Saliphagus sp. LR7 TaxID=2282654 RepID=UPI000DF84519|nr:S8 family serine peptidase [Saliphagus sp. LR7]
MSEHTSTRRRVLQGIAASGLTIGFIGTGSAESGTTYVVTGGSRRKLKKAGFSVTRELAGGSVAIVSGPADAESDLKSVGGVSGVTENFEVELANPVTEDHTTKQASFTELQWDKEITDTFEAHHYATGDDTRIVIADTGVDGTHPDLAGNFNEGLSRSFINGGEEAPHMGPAGGDHATHVAGTAAATGDVGITGTAPDAEIVSVRVLGPDSSSFADVLAGADYAAEIGADATNFSLGAGPYPSQANSDGLRVAVQKVMQDVARRGTVLTVSAGNNETNLQQGQSCREITNDDGEVVDVVCDNWHYVPGTVQGVMTISATTPNDELAFYSNYGTNAIEVGAPGGGYETLAKTVDPTADVEWPYPTNLVYSSIPGASYGWKAGTSMAAPQVAGLVGLVRELKPGLKVNQVENIIAHGADLVQGRSSPEFGAGRINVLDTVERVGGSGGD